MHQAIPRAIVLWALLSACQSVQAAGPSGLAGKAQTFGRVAGDPTIIGTLYNPAVGFVKSRHVKSEGDVRGELASANQTEYGEIDNLFTGYDELGDYLSAAALSKEGALLAIEIDISHPNFQEIIHAIDQEASRLNTRLDILSEKGFARSTEELTLSVLLDNDIAGGTLTFDYAETETKSLTSIAETIPFDAGAALAVLSGSYDLTADSPAQTFALNDDVLLTIDPTQRSASLAVVNESALLTRITKTEEFVFGYSRPVLNRKNGRLTVGIAPKLIASGLISRAFYIGEQSDTEMLFEDIRIRHTDFHRNQGVGINAGLYWQGHGYNIGVSGHDLTETEFDFAAADTAQFSNPEIIAKLQKIDKHKLERQFTLEGGLTLKHLQLNLVTDTQRKQDLLGVEYQWASVSGSYQ